MQKDPKQQELRHTWCRQSECHTHMHRTDADTNTDTGTDRDTSTGTDTGTDTGADTQKGTEAGTDTWKPGLTEPRYYGTTGPRKCMVQLGHENVWYNWATTGVWWLPDSWAPRMYGTTGPRKCMVQLSHQKVWYNWAFGTTGPPEPLVQPGPENLWYNRAPRIFGTTRPPESWDWRRILLRTHLVEDPMWGILLRLRLVKDLKTWNTIGFTSFSFQDVEKALVLLCFRSKMLKKHWFYSAFTPKC